MEEQRVQCLRRAGGSDFEATIKNLDFFVKEVGITAEV